MEWLAGILNKYPELAVFLALGIGYWIGAIKIGGIGLGPVTGSLFAGLAMGAFFPVPVSAPAKSLLFLLFLFGIGYSVGPQFFRAMKGDGLRWGALGVFCALVGLGASVVVARLLHLDAGYAGGLLSGALTESPAIGTAVEAIQALPLDEATRQRLASHVAIGDAVCYVFGAIGVIFFVSQIGPRLLGLDLTRESRRLEAALGMERKTPGVMSAWTQFGVRAYRVAADGRAVDKTVGVAEGMVPDARLFILRLRRGGTIIDARSDTVLQAGDIVAVSGRRETLLDVLGRNANEVEDRDLLDIPIGAFDVYLTNKRFAGPTLAAIVETEPSMRGVFVRYIRRGDQQIPIAPGTVLQRGDMLRLVGSEPAARRAATLLGVVVFPSDTTDMVTLGLGIVAGAIVGILVVIPIGELRIQIGTSVGTLLAGLVVGWLYSVRPLFGRIPDAAISFMTAIGLAGFIAMIGLSAGPHFIEGVREVGVGLVLGGIVVTLLPQVAGLYFGWYVLKLEPLLVLGGLAGAQTMTAGLAALQERSDSPVAVLGYSGTVAIAHILLTTWGTVIVWLTT
ncbi:MAG: aspartate-alanine antiporter [Sulfurifustaceae bacterium]